MYSMLSDEWKKLCIKVFYRLFENHPWNLKKNIDLLIKARKSKADERYTQLIRSQNAFIMFSLVVNRLHYDTCNTLYLPIELWNIIKIDIVNDLNDRLKQLPGEWIDVLQYRYPVDTLSLVQRICYFPIVCKGYKNINFTECQYKQTKYSQKKIIQKHSKHFHRPMKNHKQRFV